ncbi:MAG: class I SAM-dependent methyltransferase [Thermomicrobiales bacterium]
MTAEPRSEQPADTWESGDQYEPYVGRWSRLVAREFLPWLGRTTRSRWLDVGCGTGALTQIILEQTAPLEVVGVDPSPGFIAYARRQITDPRVRFESGDARYLPLVSGTFDIVVSGLVLNFVPQPDQAVAEMRRTARPGGLVGSYVWDYAGKMELMRYFWDAVVALDPNAADIDEGRRFPLCNPDQLTKLFARAGIQRIETGAVDVPTVFRDFDDYWQPFVGGQGPAPSYAMSLSAERRDALRDHIRARLPIEPDGSIHLIARAWAVKGLA